MNRAFYSDPIATFLHKSEDEILSALVRRSSFAIEGVQRDAWLEEIRILRVALAPYSEGRVYFEYSVPRLGKRIDVVLLLAHVVFILEFKVGETEFSAGARDQVWDYALDLKNFHQTSHECVMAPILIATNAKCAVTCVSTTAHADGLLLPANASAESLSEVITAVLRLTNGAKVDAEQWERGRYCPTPTIIEAAMALYNGHSVTEISRSDASAMNLTETSGAISKIIQLSKEKSRKSICFVTGVPGAGKTLVGLDIATKHIDKASELYSVFLSGNGPLVAILREALTRDKVRRERGQGRKMRKGAAMSEVKLFIQNVHHFRDECLVDRARPPIEHVALFDEAQRAWNRKQTSSFMRRKKKVMDFDQSEPAFLIFLSGSASGLGSDRVSGRRRARDQYGGGWNQRMGRISHACLPRLGCLHLFAASRRGVCGGTSAEGTPRACEHVRA